MKDIVGRDLSQAVKHGVDVAQARLGLDVILDQILI